MDPRAAHAWQTVLGQLQREMPKASFDTWVRDAQVVTFDDGVFTIGVHNAYARDWLADRLTKTVEHKLAGVLGQPVQVRFVVWNESMPSSLSDSSAAPHVTASAAPNPPEGQALNPTLNPRYTFQNFVVGASNRLAHAASLAVAENPARAYNPLFIYGGVGLGKTHLLHAIGNRCTQDGLRVRYVSSEEFTNDLINAIRAHTTQAFREKYRHVDVLLIDDIQFIAGKESTQEEFFHTFNTLHSQNKQIVISSDRPPKALVTLEERLRSRFEWGLTADIQPPDFETRVAILRFKAEESGRQVPDGILEAIARRMQSNIRELEGALTRVLAYADLRGVPLSLELVDIALADLIPRRRDLDPQRVVALVAEEFGVPVERLLSKERSRKVVLPRQVAMYLLREEARISLPQIGETLGGRDHTTVMYACHKVADLLERDERLRRRVMDIRERLHGRPQPLPV